MDTRLGVFNQKRHHKTPVSAPNYALRTLMGAMLSFEFIAMVVILQAAAVHV